MMIFDRSILRKIMNELVLSLFDSVLTILPINTYIYTWVHIRCILFFEFALATNGYIKTNVFKLTS